MLRFLSKIPINIFTPDTLATKILGKRSHTVKLALHGHSTPLIDTEIHSKLAFKYTTLKTIRVFEPRICPMPMGCHAKECGNLMDAIKLTDLHGIFHGVTSI